ncbi:MAG: hypothetical protein ACLQLG_18675 [Thermoguttaceae bacterium]
MRSLFCFLATVAVMASSTALAQTRLELPQDAGKYHVSVCVNDLSIADEAKYVRWFDADPVLRQIKAQAFFHVYTAADPVFRNNLGPALPCGCPAVVVQRNREYSGPLYAAGARSRTAPLPETAEALADKLLAVFDAERGRLSMATQEKTPGQLAWLQASNGEAVPGGPPLGMTPGQWAAYCDECRRKHAALPRPTPLPLPLPGPIQNLIPSIETDVPPAQGLMEFSMHPILVVCCVALVILAACALAVLVIGLGVAGWLHHCKKKARREMLQGAAVLGVGTLLYNGDQHRRRHRELIGKMLEIGAALLGGSYLAAEIRKQQPRTVNPRLDAPAGAPNPSGAGQPA